MTNFHDALQRSVVDFEGLLEQAIQRMEASGTDRVDGCFHLGAPRLFTSKNFASHEVCRSNGKERPSSQMVCLVARCAMD